MRNPWSEEPDYDVDAYIKQQKEDKAIERRLKEEQEEKDKENVDGREDA